MPGAAVWPGTIKAGAVSDAMVSTMDIFPTALALAGVQVGADYPVDGKDMTPVLTGHSSQSQHAVFLHYCGFNIVAARVWGRYKVFWGQQKWYVNDPYNASVCTQCCNGVNPSSRLTGTTATLLCGCDIKDINWFEQPIVYDMSWDRLELNSLSADNWPSTFNVTYEAVVSAANATKADMEKEIDPKPDITGAGTCTAGLPTPARQPCCPGCKPTGFPFPHCTNANAVFRRGQRCNCDNVPSFAANTSSDAIDHTEYI